MRSAPRRPRERSTRVATASTHATERVTRPLRVRLGACGTRRARLPACASDSRPHLRTPPGPTCSRSGRPPTRSSSSSRRGPSTTSTRSSPTTSSGPCLEGWVTTDRPGPGDAPAAGRGARHRHAVPAPGGARQDGRHARHRLRRPAGARHRRGLERGGGEGLRHRPPPDPHRALRRLRRGLRGDHRPAHQRDHHASTVATCSSWTRTATRSRCSGRTHRSASAGRASAARFARWRASRSTGTTRAVRSSSSRPSSTCCAGTATTSGATRRRSPCRRTCGVGADDSRGAGEALRRRRSRPRHRVPPAAAHTRRCSTSSPLPSRRCAADGRADPAPTQRVQPAALRSTHVGQIG